MGKYPGKLKATVVFTRNDQSDTDGMWAHHAQCYIRCCLIMAPNTRRDGAHRKLKSTSATGSMRLFAGGRQEVNILSLR